MNLYYHILPSINLNQYKIFKDEQGILWFCKLGISKQRKRKTLHKNI